MKKTTKRIAGDNWLSSHSAGPRGTWSAAENGLRLHVWRANWPTARNRESYESRSISFFIRDAKGRTVGAGYFEEWRFNYLEGDAFGGPDLDDFVLAADLVSQSAYDLSEVVLKAWGTQEKETGENPFHYGNVVLFDRLRIDATSKLEQDTAWSLIDQMIERQFRQNRNRASIIVLKPFPLEYEGGVDQGNQAAFERRTAAMVRLYANRLGARLLDGKGNWMWIEINLPTNGNLHQRTI
jgi:hypothetical protein